MEKYIIACDYYPKVPNVSMIGDTTLAVTTKYAEKPSMTVYLRGYENKSEPRLNVKELAMVIDSKERAETIAAEINANTWDEGKIVARVEVK